MRNPAAALVAAAQLVAGIAAAAGPVVSGHVRLDSGKPVPQGISIELRPAEGNLERAQRLMLRRLTPGAAVARAPVDSTGAFELRAPDAGMWVLSVEAKGYLPIELRFLPLVDDREAADLVLRVAGSAGVELLDAAGKPVPGALVSRRTSNPGLWRGTPGAGEGQLGEVIEVTDSGGHARLPCAAGGHLDFTAVTPDGALAEGHGVCGAPVPVKLALRAEAEQRLAVRGAQNEALGAAILLDPASLLPLAETRRDGSAKVHVPPLGRELQVLAAGYARLRTTVRPLPAPAVLRLQKQAMVTGRVLDSATREPLSSALVWPGGRANGAVRASARGEFSLPLDAGDGLVATAPGHSSAIAFKSDAHMPTTLLLEPVVVVTGRVLDSAKRPVADVALTAHADLAPSRGWNPRVFMRQMQESAEAKSGPDGRFRLRGLFRDLAYTVSARHPGFAAATASISPAPPGVPPASLDIVLSGGAEAVLRVLDAQGKPLAGARAELKPGKDPSQRYFRMVSGEDDGAAAVSSDSQGVARWRHLPPGRFDIDVRASGFSPVALPGVEVPKGVPRAVDLGTVRLSPGAALFGVVVDLAGQPVPEASIWAAPRQGFLGTALMRAPDAVSAADGSFRIDDLAPGGLFHVVASATGWSDTDLEGVAVPSERPVRLVMAPRSRVRGRIVNAEAKPLGGAAVMVRIAGRSPLASMPTAPKPVQSEDDGSFTLSDVPASAVVVSATLEGYQPATSAELTVQPGRDLEGVEIVLRLASAVHGTIVDGDGAPLTDARVAVQGNEMIRRFDLSEYTDGDGRYRLPAVPPGIHTIVVESDSAGRAAQELDVKPGENELDFRVANGVEVSGVVVDEKGEPIAGAQLSLEAPEIGSLAARRADTAGDGRFAWHGVPKGVYSLAADHKGFASATLQPVTVADAPVTGLELHLGRGGSIVGALRGLSLDELSRVGVSARSLAGTWRTGSIDVQGRYRVDAVAAGEWSVSANAGGGSRRASGRVRLEEGASEATLDLDFSRGFTLSGTLSGNGQPEAGAMVLLLPRDGKSSGSTETDSSGRFRLEGLEAGSYNLLVRSHRLGGHREVVELSEDREISIDLVAGAIHGRVFDREDKSPLAGARIETSVADDDTGVLASFGSASAVTDSQGAFRIDEAAAGRWTVKANLDGYATGTDSVVLTEGGDSMVELGLERTQGLALDLSDASGPVRNAQVGVLGPNGVKVFASGLAATDAGRVRIATLPAGTYRVFVAAGTSAVALLTATVPGPPIPVVLEPGARVEITIPALADSSAQAMVELYSEMVGNFRIPAWNDLESGWSTRAGKLELTGVPPGVWTVNAAGPSGSWTATFTVPPGATVPVELH